MQGKSRGWSCLAMLSYFMILKRSPDFSEPYSFLYETGWLDPSTSDMWHPRQLKPGVSGMGWESNVWKLLLFGGNKPRGSALLSAVCR